MSRFERPPLKQAARVGSILNEIFKKQGMAEQITRHQAWLLWDQLVGPQIAARARPKRLRHGTLEVQVDHPVWMQQLQMMKPQILEKLAAQIPAAGITDLYLRLARTPRPQKSSNTENSSPTAQVRSADLSHADRDWIEQQLSKIEDPRLKAELRSLLSCQKQLDKARREQS